MDESDYLMNTRRNSRFPKHKTVTYYLCDSWANVLTRCCEGIWSRCMRARELKHRTIDLSEDPHQKSRSGKFPANVIRNQKYSVITFIPLVLYEQFKYFLNLFFLVMALSQFIPEMKVGYLYTYWFPLLFVLTVTLIREAVDDFRRFVRDREVNTQKYKRLTPLGVEHIASQKIKVGDLIIVEKDQRVPADMVLVRTSDKHGTCFIRTDQLDGETDWKLRVAIPSTQRLNSDKEIFNAPTQLFAEKPQKDIHSFIGTFSRSSDNSKDSLNVENTMWTNTVLASGSVLGAVVYTGCETRSVMNTSKPSQKVGLLDLEVNTLSKVLFFMVFMMSLAMMIMKGFGGPWYRYMFRFLVLFSYIIPLSLRVNLDVGKMVYAYFIQKDAQIPDTVVRNTTIAEEMGRITYLLSDKTGTLTQNEMVFKRFHIGSASYTSETKEELTGHLQAYFSQNVPPQQPSSSSDPNQRLRNTLVNMVTESIKGLALCHNVTPMSEGGDKTPVRQNSAVNIGGSGVDNNVTAEQSDTEADQQLQHQQQTVSYQASSPDEVALVTWTESVGLTLLKRDLSTMMLRTPDGQLLGYDILQIFPFTSETKRMGIVVRDQKTNEITFYMKGADVVMQKIVQYNDWMKEECDNMAREGLRTLVLARKTITQEQYLDFESRYQQAKLSVSDRLSKVSAVVDGLERDMQLLCVTGVEDKLHDNVPVTLELLRNAGIKVWMLTGDKLETATCIAKSSCLVSRLQTIHVFKNVLDRADAHLELNAFRRRSDCALVISGDSLEICLRYYEHEFMELACQCPTVVVCRCSPTQKADVVKLLKYHTGKQTCAVGDGGNDVSMIQAADVGIGIVGKEGKQAALAADFSVSQFSHIGPLLLVHGRNSYMRSAALSQFVIHRGLIISSMQAVFSAVFYFASLSLFPGFLLVGYATVYTNFPVFSLVLDKDVSAEIAMKFPELYKGLTKGRALNFRTFFMWVLISIYQGGAIMILAFILFEADFIHIVSISFSSLILTELLMVALTIHTWHYLMIVGEFLSLVSYVVSLFIFKSYFDVDFLLSWNFLWKVLVTTSVSCIPLFILKYLRRRFAPPSYTKLS
ncbi:hypothetical protein HELRODRAFT_96328 [Helobdella robusta]|uniref:Phospholipid-transporting ATPase n=1 Tax=Helobdella robusta TaxID=6412 RepID=T1G9B4_HELRO|nr:hypothetical protein HELRODRAFT_96328 [Helobdella robusta]ESN91643.1 hypothetical protein HELRODRAFT_96328 [Helobdella robusta]